MRRSLSIALSGLLGGALLATARPAHADPWWQWMLGGDASAVLAGTRDRDWGGLSVDARGGFRRGPERFVFITRFPLAAAGYLFYQPELIAGYHQLPLKPAPDDIRILRWGGGFRAGVAFRPIEVMIVNHYGGGIATQRPEHGFLGDVGLAVDGRRKQASIGGHATWYHLNDLGGWLEVGLHFEWRWLPKNWFTQDATSD